MGKLLLRWILMAASIVAASYVSRALNLGFEAHVDTFGDGLKLLIGVAVLGFLNATLGRVIKFFTLPLTCLTLGLFALVVNAAVFYAAAKLNLGFRIVEHDEMRGFFAAFVASILVSFINGVLGVFLPDDDKDD
jgi:putative membrane protein